VFSVSSLCKSMGTPKLPSNHPIVTLC
jgi:hypothetical protein